MMFPTETGPVLLLLAVVNMLGFALMGFDKAKARAAGWRVRESTLLSVALVFGSYGVFLGMQFFKHKTRHLLFSVAVPLLMLLQSLGLIWIFTKMN